MELFVEDGMAGTRDGLTTHREANNHTLISIGYDPILILPGPRYIFPNQQPRSITSWGRTLEIAKKNAMRMFTKNTPHITTRGIDSSTIPRKKRALCLRYFPNCEQSTLILQDSLILDATQ